MARATLPFFFLCCICVGAVSAADGVYSKAQAARGKASYGQGCAKCHGANLEGGEVAPALSGADFQRKWAGRTVAQLFNLILQTMPTDDPGSLSRRESADIVALVLEANDYPSGPKDLGSTAEALAAIQILPKK